MKLEHLDELITIEKNYWWHVAKRAIVTDLLKRFRPPPADLLEGGIGGGANLLFWRNHGYNVSGCDILPAAVQHCHSKGLKKCFIHDLNHEWPESCSFADILVLLDVLEHMKDPVTFLKHTTRVLKQQGIIILTVPALPWLIGPWDYMLGHYRRYTLKLLQKDAQRADLEIVWISYWNSYTLPVAVIVRLIRVWVV
jgi:2-polyprenyl-3-methyl-5-hydroxy-6-metoxy-1,4-benzoquinol methylase